MGPIRSASRLLIPAPARHLTRRAWLRHCAIVTGVGWIWQRSAGAEQVPPQFSTPATPCDPSATPTPARAASGYRAGAPIRTKLAKVTEPGQVMVVSGTVSGLRCGLVAGATLDIWQADARGVSDASGMRLRGRQLTDAQGRYRVETIVPGPSAGRAPRINVRVNVPGKATLTTMLFLPEAVAGAANARDSQFDPLLAMTLTEKTAARLTTRFDVILDL